jgi:hypothetical protein
MLAYTTVVRENTRMTNHTVSRHEITRQGIARKLALPAVLFATVLSACGDTSTLHAEKAALSSCGNVDAFKKGSNKPVTSVRELVASATTDVLTLYRRAVHNGGELDFPRYSEAEIMAGDSKLSLFFHARDYAFNKDLDEVTFQLDGSRVAINAGAVACTSGSSIYPNSTFQALEGYVKYTAALDK